MKNPLKFLKHVVKDPVNTIPEANARKKEIMPILYVSLGVLALGLILQLVAKLDFMLALSFVGLVGVGFSLFLLSIVNSVKKRFECLTCDKCNTLAEIKNPEDFAKYISYTVEKDVAEFKGYSGNKEATNGVFSLVKYTASSTAVVSIKLTCPKCGAVKELRYVATPFKCHASAQKVGALQFQAVSSSLEKAVRDAVNDYNTPDRKHLIPYTYHSSKNPNFEERFTVKGVNGKTAKPDYMGTVLDYRKDIEEMVEHYFVINELNGSLTDPNKSKK